MKEEILDIVRLQEQMGSVRSDVSTIMTNHLPHIYETLNKIKDTQYEYNMAINKSMDSIKTRMAYYVGGGTAVMGLIQLWAALHK